MEKKSKEKKANNKKKNRVFIRIVLILLLIISIAAGIFIYKWQKNGGGWKGAIKTTLGYDETKQLDKIYCLLLGQSQNLTDTIMIASYDPNNQQASLLSIPRDTFIGESKAYASGYDKINAVYSAEGIEELLDDVNRITGLNVEYYLKVDTEALKVLVDEIGGVYFEVPIDMNYTDRKQNLYIDLEAGYQLLDGDKAEQVVRFRHNSDGTTYPSEYGGEDLGRMRTQRAFLTALLEQTIENMDITKIFDFLEIAKQYVKTNLDFNVIKEYVPYVLDFKIENLKTATLPGIAEQASVSRIWIYSVYEDEVEEVIDELFHGKSSNQTDGNIIEGNTVTGADIGTEEINIEVLNGSGSSSKLSDVVDQLENAGFNVSQTGNTSTTSNTTIIEREDIKNISSEKIKEVLGTQNIISGESSQTVDVTVIIGTDYNL